jgi:hypothetical protein
VAGEDVFALAVPSSAFVGALDLVFIARGALTIAARGSRFPQTFGRLRVTIDAVLDVDNYFRDPPNRPPPRALPYLHVHVQRGPPLYQADSVPGKRGTGGWSPRATEGPSRPSAPGGASRPRRGPRSR